MKSMLKFFVLGFLVVSSAQAAWWKPACAGGSLVFETAYGVPSYACAPTVTNLPADTCTLFSSSGVPIALGNLIVDGVNPPLSPYPAPAIKDRCYLLSNASYIDPRCPAGSTQDQRAGVDKCKSCGTGTGQVLSIVSTP